MNSTTITIGLVVLALAVGGWILMRGGKEEEEEPAGTAATGSAPPGVPVAPRPPGVPAAAPAAMPMNPAAAVPPAAPMSSVPYGMPGAAAVGGYPAPAAPAAPVAQPPGMYGGGGGQFLATAPLTSEAHAYEVRTRWQELQLRFLDDPQTAAGEAERLVDDALAGVTASLNARKDQLSNWRASGRDDTEQLRAAVHGYRDFLNHLVGS